MNSIDIFSAMNRNCAVNCNTTIERTIQVGECQYQSVIQYLWNLPPLIGAGSHFTRNNILYLSLWRNWIHRQNMVQTSTNISQNWNQINFQKSIKMSYSGLIATEIGFRLHGRQQKRQLLPDAHCPQMTETRRYLVTNTDQQPCLSFMRNYVMSCFFISQGSYIAYN